MNDNLPNDILPSVNSPAYKKADQLITAIWAQSSGVWSERENSLTKLVAAVIEETECEDMPTGTDDLDTTKIQDTQVAYHARRKALQDLCDQVGLDE